MNYILIINGKNFILDKNTSIAQTKQVNDLATLSNRQSNVTATITIPFNANNIRNMESVYLVGNRSNIPYQKNETYLYDGDNGECLIYKGWTVFSQTTEKGYEINIYDGIIDFYKEIENLNLTQVDITGLDHVKNLDTVIATWDDSLPYKYLIADYNGKNNYTSAGVIHFINIDYQIPSARTSYLWDRVHQFAGFTYTGSIFINPKFLNHYMSFPKPVPTTDPIVTNITSQESTIGVNSQGLENSFFVKFFPINFNTAVADNNIFANTIKIKHDGSYRLKVDGSIVTGGVITGQVSWMVYGYDTLGVLVTKSSGVLNSLIGESAIISAKNGDNISIGGLYVTANVSGSITSTFDLVDGYSANFSETLVDFLATDFINEIMQRFGLTAFKDKYSNNIEYLTFNEILQSNNVIDWSKKFDKKVTEKYNFGNYAIKNNFTYRYNDDNDTHNDGYFTISNENLEDNIDIITSKIYSPQIGLGYFGPDKTIYKFWDKEVKDDGTINYKDLDGRYYFMRSQNYINEVPLKIGSEILNTENTITNFPVASFDRLSFQEIIYDFYSDIQSILNKLKVDEVNLYLNSLDVQNFDFKSLVYIEQLSSYFLVNKIPNFVKGKLTKCELIKVDYKKSTPDEPTVYTIVISNPVMNDCQITFDVVTNLPQPTNVIVTATTTGFIVPPQTQTGADINAVLDNNQITFPISSLPPQYSNYAFLVSTWTSSFIFITSNIINTIAIDGSCYIAPAPKLTSLTITSIETLSIVGSNRNIRVHYTSDLTDPGMNLYCLANVLGPNFSFEFYGAPQNGYVDISVGNIGLGGVPAIWYIKLQALGITSNIVTS